MMEHRIKEFCVTPRTLETVCLFYGLTLHTGYDVLTRMTKEGLLTESYDPSLNRYVFQTSP